MLAHEVGSFEAEIGDLGATFQLNLRPPHGSDDEEIERAVALARDADVAVVVVGTTEEVESEGFDRTSLALPGRQDELVRRVAQANPATVVVVNAGAPVLLPWADEVAAILVAWFPGQEFGNALADVVLGDSEPGGRLPTTWPSSEDGLPSTQPADGVLAYDEGLFIGYRAYDRDGRTPHYPFGHGLGYTTWSYDAIDAPAEAAPGDDTVRHRPREQHRYPPRPGGRPALREPCGRPRRATRPLARRLRAGRGGGRGDRDRDRRRCRPGPSSTGTPPPEAGPSNRARSG